MRIIWDKSAKPHFIARVTSSKHPSASIRPHDKPGGYMSPLGICQARRAYTESEQRVCRSECDRHKNCLGDCSAAVPARRFARSRGTISQVFGLDDLRTSLRLEWGLQVKTFINQPPRTAADEKTCSLPSSPGPRPRPWVATTSLLEPPGQVPGTTGPSPGPLDPPYHAVTMHAAHAPDPVVRCSFHKDVALIGETISTGQHLDLLCRKR
ncbi:hypothetical protein VTI74DRAFT_3437 [Chaetomium olivicolor]